ncbi:hypothetical protein [Aquisalibacillus elongatus]|uniref:Uncharacterized protein n=1 Tax=Aquisalibacillus elongatus TaxID=485577 RepID=A0A3N5B8E2_9BACI|nr:hypothetical protein [Aquisalibacillus elongatus]RPF53279.1 hypothetical protein EDC24_1776 [Aquisalibacillus elongatus]
MRFLSKLLIFLGSLVLLVGIILAIVDFPKGEEWRDIISYLLFESSARVALLFGVLFLIFGGLFSKKAKRKDRIFY